MVQRFAHLHRVSHGVQRQVLGVLGGVSRCHQGFGVVHEVVGQFLLDACLFPFGGVADLAADGLPIGEKSWVHGHLHPVTQPSTELIPWA